MSKRDKDKAARKAARDAGLIDCPAPGVDPDRFAAWMKDKNRQLDQNELEAIAAALDIALPEIDVEDFRAAGYLPEVICNYIALLGWSPGDDIEKFDMDFLAQRFDPKRIGKTNARFDYRKLLAFNNDAFAAMSDDEFARRWRLWCLDHAPELLDALGAMDEVNDAFLLLAGATRPRCKTFRDGVEGARFLLTPDDEIQYDEKAVEKALRKNDGEGIDTLRALRAELEHAQPWAPQRLHELVASFAEARGVGMGKVAQPLRVALTGGAVSPPIDATLAALGRQRTLGRIDRCLREIA